jgi:ABC-type nickel/cobalt efflux system permease component RcnA
VTLELKNPAALAGLLISLFTGLVAALLWLMPKPFSRLEYMIAGTAATALTLLVTLLVLTPGATAMFRRKFRQSGTDAARRRTVRRSEQSS